MRGWLSLLVGSLMLAAPARAAERAHVTVGVANSMTDAAAYLAQANGYFRDEGLEVSFLPFDSAARMIAPFASGDLDVGGGGPSAGLYNAVARGIGVKIVADKNRATPGRGVQPLIVRRDLVESGRFKSLADLKGLKVATAAPGSSASPTLERALRLGGLKEADIDHVFMGFPQQAVALENKAIDAALIAEPSASQAVASGAGVRFIGDDEIYPNHQLAVIFYGSAFIEKRRDVALRYMRVFLRGVRAYNDAIVDGRLDNPRGEKVIDALADNIPLSDKALYRRLIAPACDPDGNVNVASLQEDVDFFRRNGDVQSPIDLTQALDTSFARAAVAALGPYRPMDQK